MRAVFAFMAQGFRQQAAYRVEGVLGLVSSLIWFLLYAGIWAALLRGDPEAMRRQMAYVITSRFLADLHFLPVWEVAFKFRQGDVGLELIKPLALPLRFLGDFLGRSGFRLLRSFPVFVLIWWLFGLPVPPVERLALFVISALLGWVIQASLNMALCLVALWTVQFNEAQQLFFTVSNLLSGAFIPLHYLPRAIGTAAAFLPFAGTYYVPAGMMSGTLQGAALLQALALQAVWAGVGSAILLAVWGAGSRKLVMQGG